MNPNGQVSRSRTFYRFGSVCCIYYVGTQLIQEITGRIQVCDESVGAIYFALLGAHLLASVCFAIATWERDDKWSLVVALGFGLTAIEYAGRILEGYLGQKWLSGANYAAYFPIVFLSFGALAVWLWRPAPAIRE